MASSLVSSLAILLLFLSFTAAREILVGGKADAWKIPTSDDDSLNTWAASSRFRVGDSLVWKYDGEKDSVLQVTREGYLSCNTTSPLEEHKGGNNTVKLERSGPHYFISGAEGHCQKGEKLIMVVLSQRHSRYVGISPSPSPAGSEGPAVAPSPTSGARSLRNGLTGFVIVAVIVLGFLF